MKQILMPKFLRRKRRLELRWKTFFKKILLPNILAIYFIYTEEAFIQTFSDQFEIMGVGEYLFLNTHIALVYFLMPFTLVSQLFMFLGAKSYEFTYEFFSFISKALLTILSLAALGKLIFEIFS